MTEVNGKGELEQARLLIVTNHLEDAKIILKEAIGREPQNEQAFNLLGVVYEKEGNIEGACLMYRVALAINSTYQPAQSNLHRLVQMPPNLMGINLGA